MRRRTHSRNVLLLALVAMLAACSEAPTQAQGESATAGPPLAPQTPATTAPATSAGSESRAMAMVVHKSATCGCCTAWVDHMRQAGFAVEVRDAENLEPVKTRLGIPPGKGSCHTAEIGGYFVEGHVPAADVKRLLADKPDAKGLVLPGMPAGSPGMEMPDGRTEPYTVELVRPDGATEPFASH